jgi:hypothetical protein
LLELLLQAGADVNALAFGSTPALTEALYFQNTDLALWLLENGADISPTSTAGKAVWNWLEMNPTWRRQRKLIEDFKSRPGH